MSKGSPSIPAVPNPTATANAQTASNVDTSAAQAALNNVNQYTPYGDTTYSQTGSYTTPGGQTVPTYTQKTELNPLAQQLLTGQETLGTNILPTANTLAQNAATSATTPLNFNTPYSSTLNQGPQLLDQNTTNALYNEQTGFLDPQWQREGQQLQDQLSRQGIPVGSQAYNDAMQQYNQSKTQAYQTAQDQAIAGGTSAANNLFNMALSGQQQNIGQQQLQQQNPINLMQQLLGASPSTPSQPITTPTPTTVSPTDVIGATGLSQNAAMQQYQAQLAQQNAMFGGLASLGSAGLMASLMG